MTLLLVLHLLVGIAIVAVGGTLGRRGAWLGLLAPVATLAWLAARWTAITSGTGVHEHVSWIPQLGLGYDLRIDGFAALMILLVSGVGTAVFVYTAGYLPSTGPRVGRLVGLLVLFGGAMLGLVTADNLLILYGFWELTSVTSFLLIGNDHDKPEARAAAVQAFLITGAGGLAMLGGFLVLGVSAGTFRLSEILAEPPSGRAVSAALVLILIGAFTKSAQVPFHSWLPGAMVAPTPVSAYLHSATMVKAGVYLVARLSPTFAATEGWWRPTVVTVGAITMLAGGLRALRQNDLKLLLAHGTVSQLGFLIAVFGIGTPEAMVGGTALLVAHAAFKATNFMAVGAVDHQFGTRDLRRLPRLDRSWAATVTATVAGAASMAGIPLTFGFIAKELDFAALFDRGISAGWWLADAAAIAGASLTAGYSLRFVQGLLGRSAEDPVDTVPSRVVPGPLLVVPMLALTAATVVFGLVPRLLEWLIDTAGDALHPDMPPVHLAVWHGVNGPLLASGVALAVGVALYAGRGPVSSAIVRAGRFVPDGNALYRGALRAVNETADRVTGVSQPGSLPIYAGVILVTAAALPIWGLVARGSWPGWPAFVDTPAQIPVVAALLGAALAASVVRRRFSAALFLGAAGYAMSALFVVQGAPDLALTQAAMETLSTVLFVLVLRRLPDRFTWAPETGGSTLRDKVRRRLDERNEDGSPVDSPMTARTRMLRVLAAVCVGGAVFVLAIAMSGEPKPSTVTAPTASGLPPAADEMVERSLPDGHGRNVVNVTLVDFRGFDTLGEITVLACAAIGTVALARSGRRPARRRDAQRTALRRGAASFEPPSIVTTSLAGPSASSAGVEAPPGAVRPTAASGGPARLGHLVVLDVAVRIVFAAVMVGSIYLLFAGHNQPGGGFVGGILAGAAVSLRYVAGGIDAVRSLSRARPWTVLGAGLVLSVSTALVPILLGHPVLTSAYRSFDVPVLGSVSLTSVMVFDLGVYLVVLALALMMFESFGDDLVDEQPDDRTPLPTPAPPAPGTDAAAPHRFVARNRPVSGRPRAHSHVGAAEVTP